MSLSVRLLSIVTGLLLLGGQAVAGPSTVIQVPADYPTIQAAINAAGNGDAIQVSPGTYVENLNFLGKAIQVIGLQGPAVTVIDGNQAGSVVSFVSGEGPQSVLSGFTLQNGKASGSPGLRGGGIRIENSSPTITGNIITNNTAGDGGGGISSSFSSPLIQGNLITNNSQIPGWSGGVGGGGVTIVGASAAQLLNNVISGNSWSASGGGVTLFAAGTPAVKNNFITNNSAFSQGGGIWMVNYSDASIVQNVIVGNSAGTGGGVYWLVPSGRRGPFLINNTVSGNNSAQGSAVFADGFDSQAKLINNILISTNNQNTVVCGTMDASVPVFLFNDVTSTGGQPYAGTCANQTGSNGNISADPQFVNAATGDYHLQVGSPAMDSGTSESAPDTDLDGVPRPADGNDDGVTAFDMGAYESQPVDLTSPVTTATTNPFPNAAGWNQTNTTVTLSATDNRSGVQFVSYSLSGAQSASTVNSSNPALVTITAEGTTIVGYSAVDNAGNHESPKSLVVNIDKTAPATTAAISPLPNALGWNQTNTTVTLSASDSTSGVQFVSYALSGAQSGSDVSTNPASVSITAEGTTTVGYSAVDNAGNVEGAKSFVVHIDKTAPVTTASSTPIPNSAGWSKENTTVTLNASDSGSGVQFVRYSLSGAQTAPTVNSANPASVSITAEGTTTVGYSAVDNADNNESSKALVVNIDKTAPAISGMPPASCTLSPAKHQLVQVATITASDALSGIASLTVTASSNEADSGTGGGDLPGDIVINGGTVQLRAERTPSGRGRIYTINATATDVAGNVVTSTATCQVPK
jgi:hypothetical protein